MITSLIILTFFLSFIPIKFLPKSKQEKFYIIKKRTGLSPAKYYLRIAKLLLYRKMKKIKSNKGLHHRLFELPFYSTRFILFLVMKIMR